MAKNRKTRKQKLSSDLRHQEFHPTVHAVHAELPEKVESPKAFTYISDTHPSGSTNTTVLTQDYQYVTRDLLKTAIVTGVIVALELILFFSTKGLS